MDWSVEIKQTNREVINDDTSTSCISLWISRLMNDDLAIRALFCVEDIMVS